MKFIHAADLHLDSPMRNLELYEGAPVEAVRGATRKALENLVDMALQEQVALVVLAGDLYDGNWHDYNTGLFFYKQMSKLYDANIEVVWLVGNHDAASEITKTLRSIQKLGNMHKLAEDKPETLYLPQLGVAVHGQGFAQRAVTTNLAINYPKVVAGFLNIGLLHTSLDDRPGHDTYAPCKLDDLLAKGYDYWALGHIHKPEIVHRDPWVAFAGNTQGRHIGETGARGCLLVTAEAEHVRSIEQRPLDVMRWRHCQVDVSGAVDEDMILDLVNKALLTEGNTWNGPEAVRLEISGLSPRYITGHGYTERMVNELRVIACSEFAGRLWLEKVKIIATNVHTQATGTTPSVPVSTGFIPDTLMQALHDMTPTHSAMGQLLKDRDALIASLPNELKNEDWLQITDPTVFKTLCHEVIDLQRPQALSSIWT